METMTSSSSSSRSRSFGSPTLLPVKQEPQESPLGRRMDRGVLVINKASSFHLVKPKTKPALLPVKKEHEAMAANEETTVEWARDDYVREEMERPRHTLEEITARCCSCEEGVVVILDDSDDDDDDVEYTNFYTLLSM
ncbi:SEC12-like protein 2 [Hordeum vulgare]|nr:SEC12-like protein 2 [Hordeum vulgare]